MKQTVLHEKHVQVSAKMTDFQGWQVPQSYGDITEECHAVRTRAGLFDVSFLGRIEIAGPDSVSLLQKIFTRNITTIAERSAHYGLICNEAGGILDDEIIFRLTDGPDGPRFLLTTNAGNTEKILGWLKKHAAGDVAITDRTKTLAQLSLQGPKSGNILERFLTSNFKKFKLRAVKEMTIADAAILVSRTGFTGEHGYEFFIPADRSLETWNRIMQAGLEFGTMPCGVASRDVLRLETGYPLYGNDIDESKNPVEAGLECFVDFKKNNFIGREPLLKIRDQGSEQKLAGFVLLDKNVPRTGSSIFSENREIGVVTSGAFSPQLRKGLGLGYVVTRYYQVGQEIEIEIRDREVAAKIVELPLCKKK